MTTRTKIILEGEDRTAAAFRSAKSNLQGIGSAASTANRLLAGLGVGLSASGLAAFIKGSINAAAALGDLSTRTGVAVRDLAGLQLVAKQSDTSIEALGKGINKLGVFMAENSGAAQKLGLTAKEPLQAFIQLSGILTQIPDIQLRNATANKALGQSYEQLLPALLQGPEALRAQIEAGQRYHKITGEMAEQSQKFNNNLVLLKLSAGSLGVTMAQDMLPALTDITNAMIEAQKEGRNLGVVLGVGFGGLLVETFAPPKLKPIKAATKNVNELTIELNTLLRNQERASTRGGLLNKLLYGDANDFNERIAATNKELTAARIELMKLLDPKKPSDKTTPQGKTDDSVAATACAALGGVYKNGKCEFDDGSAKARANYLKGLRDQVAMLGMSKEQTELYKAAQIRLSATQMETARTYLAQIAAYDEGVQHFKDGMEAEKKADQAAIAGKQLLIGLEKDFRVEIEKRKLALNAPLLSSSAIALSESLLDVSKRAQDARTQVEKMYVAGSLSAGTYAQRLAEIGGLEAVQKEAVKGLAAEQDKLNASFEFGAKVALREYLDEVSNVAKQSQELFKKAFRGAEDVLVDFVKTGKLNFSSLADSIITDLVRMQIQKSVTGPLSSLIDGFFGSAKGNIFDQSGAVAFARGDVVNSPTLFPFANGIGLMGEAGPEAILPLKRGADGRLGVSGAGGMMAVVNVTVNVDANGSSVQVDAKQAAELGRTLGNAVRDVLIKEKRPGGLLS